MKPSAKGVMVIFVMDCPSYTVSTVMLRDLTGLYLPSWKTA